MTDDVKFQPGKFEVMVSVAQKPVPEPQSVFVNYEGLEDFVKQTLSFAYRYASVNGGLPDVNPVDFRQDALLLTHLLASRNLAEQLKRCRNKHTRFTTPLVNPTPEMLEPIVKAYNYFGDFEHEDKRYMAPNIEYWLPRHLVRLAYLTTEERTLSGGGSDHPGNPDDVDYDLLTIDVDGDISSTRNMPLMDKIEAVSAAILQTANLPVGVRASLACDMLRVTTEQGYREILRKAKARGFTQAEADAVIRTSFEPPAAHRNALRLLFDDPSITVNPGDKIPAKKVIAVINRAYQVLRRIVDSLSLRMKTCKFSKYEGGSKAQIAYLNEDGTLYSEFPISLDEATVATALDVAYISLEKYRSAQDQDRTEVRDSLIAKSKVVT